MSENAGENALLPSGFEDLLPPQAEVEYRAIGVLMAVFSRFGYARVKPPLAEFEETLLSAGPGAALAQETFRVMDPLSHRMMALRSDITAQIARIAGSRLPGERRPLRLAYANDVIRTRASQQRTLRQFTQVGCEMIGADDPHSDAEIAVVALCGLDALELPGISLDFAVPRLAGIVLEEGGISGARARTLLTRLRGRDESALEEIEDGRLGETLKGLLRAAGPAAQALERLRALALSERGEALVRRLETVAGEVEKAVSVLGMGDVALTVDPLEARGFEYHDGIAFTVFSRAVRGELGRGGRYAIPGAPGENTSATGFTLYMDSLRQGMGKTETARFVYVSFDKGWAAVKAVQDQGWAVIRGAGDAPPPGCEMIYRDGRIQEI